MWSSDSNEFVLIIHQINRYFDDIEKQNHHHANKQAASSTTHRAERGLAQAQAHNIIILIITTKNVMARANL